MHYSHRRGAGYFVSIGSWRECSVAQFGRYLRLYRNEFDLPFIYGLRNFLSMSLLEGVTCNLAYYMAYFFSKVERVGVASAICEGSFVTRISRAYDIFIYEVLPILTEEEGLAALDTSAVRSMEDEDEAEENLTWLRASLMSSTFPWMPGDLSF
ncbi:hypothetical protein L1987_09258 [Smallanthus sonchifolius]|uniref:Uncharacterized protein n=1 Tax=Smallanthus sonchifolius TaxID=185202 RepID=A0ACB9JNG4_9ASTR|nr:hypothetical protein L1987_09258 [Smallanthus sonchifolius]